MADEIDVYQPCPCGSGKKLKFCCQAILGDMRKIGEMQAHHQPQMALAAIEALEKKNVPEATSRAWIKSTKALILAALHRDEDARKASEEAVQEAPELPKARVINAIGKLQEEGYPAAKRAIYDAFRAGIGAESFLKSQLAMLLAMRLLSQGSLMAAHQSLALAVSLDPDNKSAIEMYVRFEGNQSIPYPFRSHYLLAPFAGADELRPRFEQAMELTATACYSDAAKAFGSIARQAADQPEIWWNIALCHAWAAEEPLAVEAFKAAAANEKDPERAADCLLLSRLLQKANPATLIEQVEQSYRVQSVGKLLTLLDPQPLFLRLPEPEEEEDEGGPIAEYEVLDRDPKSVAAEGATLDSVPRALGQIGIFDADRETAQPAQVIVACTGRDKLPALLAQFEAIAGAEVEKSGEPEVSGTIRTEIAALLIPFHVPTGFPVAKAQELKRAQWARIIGEIWPNTAQEALGGKTPAEIASGPESGTALRAAALALDVHCDRFGYMLDLDAVRSGLGLPPVPPLDIALDSDLAPRSVLELRRLPFDRLTDPQLASVVTRCSRLGCATLSYRSLRAVLDRPALIEKADPSMIYMTLVGHCRTSQRSDEALEWIVKGKQAAKARKGTLENVMVWEFEELAQRQTHGDDPQIAEIANTLWNYYRPKLPAYGEMILGLLRELKIPGPWNMASGAVAGEGDLVGAATDPTSSLWTPGAETGGQTGQKLWLPGQ